jgi:hypothetical protein
VERRRRRIIINLTSFFHFPTKGKGERHEIREKKEDKRMKKKDRSNSKGQGTEKKKDKKTSKSENEKNDKNLRLISCGLVQFHLSLAALLRYRMVDQ